MMTPAAKAMAVPCSQLTAGSRQYGHLTSRSRRRLRHHWQYLFIQHLGGTTRVSVWRQARLKGHAPVRLRR